jgi:phosphatidylserine decarboxylase
MIEFIKAHKDHIQPVILKLAEAILENDWTARFTSAIGEAKSFNIPALLDISDAQSFLLWMNDQILIAVPQEDYSGQEISNRIAEFYFIFDQPPLRELQNSILPQDHAAPLTVLSGWMVDFANAWGENLDQISSVSEDSIQSFYDSPRYHMDEYMPPPSGYKTFNQLFARHVKPGMRPVAALSDSCVIVAAADSTYLGWWQIHEGSRVCVKKIEWSIFELLDDSPYKDHFKGGVFTHSFLNTNDYHRLHTPVAGTVLEARRIHGQVFLDVSATPAGGPQDDLPGVKVGRTFDTHDGTGYQFAQARGLLVLDSPIGLVAVLPIGMSQVSSVVMTANVGTSLRKGEEVAYFQFGGSDCIMLFEAAACVSLTAQLNVHYNQGTGVGLAYPA